MSQKTPWVYSSLAPPSNRKNFLSEAQRRVANHNRCHLHISGFFMPGFRKWIRTFLYGSYFSNNHWFAACGSNKTKIMRTWPFNEMAGVWGRSRTYVDQELDLVFLQVSTNLGGEEDAGAGAQFAVLLVEFALQNQLLKVHKGHRHCWFLVPTLLLSQLPDLPLQTAHTHTAGSHIYIHTQQGQGQIYTHTLTHSTVQKSWAT